jgi:hypothetical protein
MTTSLRARIEIEPPYNRPGSEVVDAPAELARREAAGYRLIALLDWPPQPTIKCDLGNPIEGPVPTTLLLPHDDPETLQAAERASDAFAALQVLHGVDSVAAVPLTPDMLASYGDNHSNARNVAGIVFRPAA